MSGQPCKNQDDVNRHRNEYLEALDLRADIDEMNLQANLVYKSTGQLPPVSQMTDNRTVEQKLKDYELLKNNIVKEIATISSATFGLMVVQLIIKNPLNINNNLLVFTAQRIKEIISNLTKIYSIGIKGDDDDAQQMVNFIIKGYNDVNSFSKSVKEYVNSGVTNSLGIMDGNGPTSRDYQNIEIAIKENRALIITFYDKMFNEISQMNPVLLNRLNNGCVGSVERNGRLGQEIENRTTILLDLLPPVGFLPFIQNAVSSIHSQMPNEVDIVEFGREYLAFLRTGYPQSASILTYTSKTRQSYQEFVTNMSNYRRFINDEGINPQIFVNNSDVRNQLLSQNDRINTTNRNITDLLTRLLDLYTNDDLSIDFLRRLRDDFHHFENIFNNGGGGPPSPPSSLSSLSSNLSSIGSNPLLSSSSSSSDGDDGSHYDSSMGSSNNSLLGLPNGPYGRAPQPLIDSLIGIGDISGISEAMPDDEFRQIMSYSRSNVPIQISQIALQYFQKNVDDLRGLQGVQLLTAVNNLREEISEFNQRYGKNIKYNNVDQTLSGSGLRKGRPKGSGIMNKKPPKAYKITVKENLNLEKGIEPTSKFIKFGKYLINNHKLHNENTLTLKHIGGGNIHCFPSKKISHNLAHVIKIISGGSLPHYNDFEKLSEPEKLYLHNVCTKSNIVDKLNIPTPNKDLYEKEIHEFEVLKGEIMSGNDNPQLIKKFKLLILKLSRSGQLPKKEVGEILEDLAHLDI